jgi:TolA-binding protein
MKVLFAILFLSAGTFWGLKEYGVFESIKHKSKVVYQYEGRVLELTQENRNLKKQISDLKHEMARLETDKNYLAIKLKKRNAKRTIASIPKPSANDLVKYEVYKWKPETLLNIGKKEFQYKKYDKSAQFYNALVNKYPDHEKVDDRVLFEAGIAAYESKTHYKWAIEHFEKLVKKYPRSKYYRGAKLWMGLSHLYSGDKDKFLETVEEFRSKYRNTKEWKVLSQYYENLVYKYKYEQK